MRFLLKIIREGLMAKVLRGKKTHGPAKPHGAKHGTSLKTAFNLVRELIVHGRLAPGTWIVEADLTERLGMSRTPIRGALHRLQHEGYVVEQRGRTKSRMIVAPLTKEDARELYAIVGRLEGLAGRQLAALPKDKRLDTVRRIKQINSRLQVVAEARKAGKESVFDLDTEFHQIIVQASAGPRLLKLHNGIKPQTERYWRLHASNIVEDLGQSVEEHQEIIAAIHDGEAARAERALIANWVNGSERVAKLIDLYGESGNW
jgi:DNA-binding GntR family transcriptional regulator